MVPAAEDTRLNGPPLNPAAFSFGLTRVVQPRSYPRLPGTISYTTALTPPGADNLYTTHVYQMAEA
jgi:hypothetical protein